MISLDDYRERNPKERGYPSDRYERDSQIEWTRQTLEDARNSFNDDNIRNTVECILSILEEANRAY